MIPGPVGGPLLRSPALPLVESLAAARPRTRVAVVAKVLRVEMTETGPHAATRVLVDDGTGEGWVVFLGRRHVDGLEVGARLGFEGTAQRGADGSPEIWNPSYRVVREPGPEPGGCSTASGGGTGAGGSTTGDTPATADTSERGSGSGRSGGSGRSLASGRPGVSAGSSASGSDSATS